MSNLTTRVTSQHIHRFCEVGGTVQGAYIGREHLGTIWHGTVERTALEKKEGEGVGRKH